MDLPVYGKVEIDVQDMGNLTFGYVGSTFMTLNMSHISSYFIIAYEELMVFALGNKVTGIYKVRISSQHVSFPYWLLLVDPMPYHRRDYGTGALYWFQRQRQHYDRVLLHTTIIKKQYRASGIKASGFPIAISSL
jgi:hypothetical protein